MANRNRRERERAWIAVLGVIAGCADPHVDSSLDVDDADGGADQVHAHWQYASGKVDVEIDVTTELGAACTTTARLGIDKALSSRDVYRLPTTPCDTLRLTADGDFVLFDAATGHDWTEERLRVDSEHEQILLGPWHSEADGVTYRFTLVAPECPDDDDCDCPRLERRANAEVTKLELGRRCD